MQFYFEGKDLQNLNEFEQKTLDDKLNQYDNKENLLKQFWKLKTAVQSIYQIDDWKSLNEKKRRISYRQMKGINILEQMELIEDSEIENNWGSRNQKNKINQKQLQNFIQGESCLQDSQLQCDQENQQKSSQQQTESKLQEKELIQQHQISPEQINQINKGNLVDLQILDLFNQIKNLELSKQQQKLSETIKNESEQENSEDNFDKFLENNFLEKLEQYQKENKEKQPKLINHHKTIIKEKQQKNQKDEFQQLKNEQYFENKKIENQELSIFNSINKNIIKNNQDEKIKISQNYNPKFLEEKIKENSISSSLGLNSYQKDRQKQQMVQSEISFQKSNNLPQIDNATFSQISINQSVPLDPKGKYYEYIDNQQNKIQVDNQESQSELSVFKQTEIEKQN